MSGPRWSVGRIIGPRGAGLGNEAIAYGKAFLGAAALGARVVDPPWVLNPRPYRRELDSSRFDAIPYAAAMALPGYTIDAGRMRSTGSVDYLDACRALTDDVRASRRPVLRHTSGMTGGFLAIRRARSFLAGRLLGAPSVAMSGIDVATAAAGRVVVGVHVRAGDFAEGALAPGVFNVRTPVAWQRAVVESFVASCSAPVSVVLCGDESVASLGAALQTSLPERCQVLTPSGDALSDLSWLARADVLVPSVSAFSMLAAFLGDGVYAWPSVHLAEAGGWIGIWAYDPDVQEHEMGAVARGAAQVSARRGLPQGDDPSWPDWVVDHVTMRAALRQFEGDLIGGGLLPATNPPS